MKCMAVLGIGEIVGSFLSGYVIDKLGSKRVVVLNVSILIVMGVITCTFLLLDDFSLLAYAVTFIWGL